MRKTKKAITCSTTKLILNKNYKNIKTKFINPCQDITTPFKDHILENTQDHWSEPSSTNQLRNFRDYRRDSKKLLRSIQDLWISSNLLSTSQPKDIQAKLDSVKDSLLRKSKLLDSTNISPDQLESMLIPEEPISLMSLFKRIFLDSKSTLENSYCSQEKRVSQRKVDMESSMITLSLSLLSKIKTESFFQSRRVNLLRSPKRLPKKWIISIQKPSLD